MRRIGNCVTTRDLYNMLSKNKWYGNDPINREMFHNIVNCVNKLISEHISLGYMVKFPLQMGYIELRKRELSPYIDKNGKVKIPYHPDWKATKELWDKDPLAKADKILIRRVQKYNYTFIYNKKRAKYLNKIFYRLNVSRPAMRLMLRNTSSGLVDAFEMGKTKYLRL